MPLARLRSDTAAMTSKTLPTHKVLIAAVVALGLLAAVVLDRIVDNAQWWWLWAW